MSDPERRGVTIYFPEFDSSHDIRTIQYIELPFWIPIKSGEYKMPNQQKIIIRNDLWLVSVANLVDGPSDDPLEFIVDEIQVSDDEYLAKLTESNAQYYHKTKMKTTITKKLVHIPPKGRITAELGSETWKEQLRKTLHGVGRHMLSTLKVINQFIDYYSSMISVGNPTKEVRRVSSYETMVRIRVSIEKDGFQYSYPTTFVPDIRMANIPYPLYRFKDDQILHRFREKLESLDEPVFHQLQWVKTLNHETEKRYEEALLNAAQTLEALAYSYLAVIGNPNTKIWGMAKWVRKLVKPLSEYFVEIGVYKDKIDYLSRTTCTNVAKLWELRNEVVHDQKILSNQEHWLIQEGIRSLGNLRLFFLYYINPELLELEKQFSSILKPIPPNQDFIDYYGQVITIDYEWRREIDDYQNPVRPTSD